MNYFPERLKVARKMNGYSLQDLSDILNQALSKQTLNRLETGETKPDSHTLSMLSKSLKVQSDYFFRDISITVSDVKFRKKQSLPIKEQDRITVLTADFLERYLELEDILGINAPPNFTPKSLFVNSQEDAEKAAGDLRDRWKLGTDPLTNIIELLEENGIKVFTVNADTSFSGMSTLVKNQIPVIVLNNNPAIPITRLRFTALHELAHLYLDLDHLTLKEYEKLCDVFAGAFLLPSSKLISFLGKNRTKVLSKELFIIGGQFGISLAAIAYRAYHLNIISANYHKFFMIQYNKFKMKEKEFSVYIGKEQSERFLQLLFRGVAEEVISTTKAATLYNQKLGDFREILDEQWSLL